MLINVINLERRVARKVSLKEHLDTMGCTYKFWQGFDNPMVMPFENISRSHKKIVEDAKENNLESVLVAEDDLRFSCKNSFQYFLQNKPTEFDLYFGMIYTGTIQDKKISHGFSGMQFYCIHNSFYDVFLSAPAKKHIDSWLGSQAHRYNFQVCEPFVCYGKSGYSDNFNRQWTFDESRIPRNLLKDDPI